MSLKYLIWGTGLLANELYEANYKSKGEHLPEIVGFVDNNKKSDYFYGIKVYRPDEIDNLEYDFIDIWVLKQRDEIESQIKSMGIPCSKIRNFLEDEVLFQIDKRKGKTGYIKPDLELLSICTDYYRCQQWYKYAYKHFEDRRHCAYLYHWISENIEKSRSILEVACGAGGMLYNLYDNGFTSLSGYDYNPNSIEAARMINRISNGGISFRIDDAYKPETTDYKYGLIVWVNGMYHLEDYSLSHFVEEHLSMLYEDGYLLFDMIDQSYDLVPGNEYRRDCIGTDSPKYPTEYKIRMTDDEVFSILNNFGFELIKNFDITDETVPHNAYVFRRV